MATTLEGPKAMELPKETLEAFSGDELRARVFYEKYAFRDPAGKIVETLPQQMWTRVSRELASVEVTPELQKQWEEKFYWLLSDWKFVPGGRILFGAGQSRKSTLLNCYYLGRPSDSIEGIFDMAKQMARTYSFGGGVGIDISDLRPKNTPVNNSAVVSTGAVSFMELFSTTTGTIGQAGRRGALMISIGVDHPDVVDFVNIKKDLSKVNHANISVRVTDEFMKAVEANVKFKLRFHNDKVDVEHEIDARELWNQLVKSAWTSAEPGLLFWDNIKRESTTEYNGMEVAGVNPCSEETLEVMGTCCLGSINLSYFVADAFTKGAKLDIILLESAVRVGVRFLDNVLDYNADKHPLPEQKIASLRSRRIGLGVTGLGDMLIKLGIKYDSEEAVAYIENLFEHIRNSAYRQSITIAEEKGNFTAFNATKHLAQPFIQRLPEGIKRDIMEIGLRNAALLTIPPVGSGSILVGSSSGVEPVFAFKYKRRSKSLSQGEFEVVNPLIMESLKANGIEGIKLNPDFVTRFINENPEFVPSHDIKPAFRVRMQGAIQKYIDTAISSTVNLPTDISVEAVGQIYFDAWKSGCKGITVYREGSRQGILETVAATNPKPSESIRHKDFVRPQLLLGKTIKMPSSQGGSLYVTANQDTEGRIMEVFIELGKRAAEDKASAEAIGRLASLYLQNGGNVGDIIRILKNIRGKSVAWSAGMQILSMPDGVAKALDIIVNDKKERKAQYTIAPPTEEPKGEICPECSEEALYHDGGCVKCQGCGFSRCG